MRTYIRHPFDIPIKYRIDDNGMIHQEDMANISEGGLCFQSPYPVETGHEITLTIPVNTPPFQAHGLVKWCKQEADHWEVGVQFDNTTTEFSMRMVEQICYIEQYRRDIERMEGRALSANEAAREWITLYAADFPQ